MTTATCKGCGAAIIWVDELGEMVAYQRHLENGAHWAKVRAKNGATPKGDPDLLATLTQLFGKRGPALAREAKGNTLEEKLEYAIRKEGERLAK